MVNETFLSEKLIALAIVLQSVELIALRRKFSDTGIFRWSLIQREFPKIARGPLTLLFNERSFLIILCLQTLCALASIVTGVSGFTGALWPLTLLSSLRFRGSFNGGADAMTLIVLTGLTPALLFPDLAPMGLGYIAFQVCFSYWRSGFEKVRRKEWRNGQSLMHLLHSRYYGVPRSAEALLRQGVAVPLTWLMLGFELTFPLALFMPATTAIYLFFGAVFHIANVYLFGLNRFFWAWLAAYPAVWFISRIFIG